MDDIKYFIINLLFIKFLECQQRPELKIFLSCTWSEFASANSYANRPTHTTRARLHQSDSTPTSGNVHLNTPACLNGNEAEQRLSVKTAAAATFPLLAVHLSHLPLSLSAPCAAPTPPPLPSTSVLPLSHHHRDTAAHCEPPDLHLLKPRR